MNAMSDIARILADVQNDLAASNDHADLIQQARQLDSRADALKAHIYGAGPFTYCLLNEGRQRTELNTLREDARQLRIKANDVFQRQFPREFIPMATLMRGANAQDAARYVSYYGD
ncbi:hypothetical protein [Chitinimonas sp. BJB300]|uniref:hypothetical protein n=1 Tax=Chitinimonas sp. BJB300 TaxID=1559339 RepID=UPI000C1183CC|nr:hypothetical protein [Chitinimonas sp. BJB300]PHV12079.1 hypothetical protein CSQ89_07645 [Chitinimonas sp. BJB300]TSJ87317.1 hypothetical protein FG002_013810 [Chitinimonas sp. BJB300]